MTEIVIGTKTYLLSCHAFCYSAYNDIFRRDIFEDIKLAQKFLQKQLVTSAELKLNNPGMTGYEVSEKVFESIKDDLGDFIDIITKLCWICMYDNDRQIESYEKWKDTLERLSINDDWVLEVIGLVASCFC